MEDGAFIYWSGSEENEGTDQNNSINVPAQAGSEVPSDAAQKPWLKFLLGFICWFLLTLPMVNFPDFLFGAYVPINFAVVVMLLLLKRTRLVGAGMASAMTVNFLVSTILGTIMPPSRLAPVIHPDVYQNRWNFHFHYVSKNITSGLISDCIAQAAFADLPASDRTLGRIAFETWRDGSPEIYLMSADGSWQENLTNHREYDAHPAWSPDGKQIAFTSLRDGNMEIYIMNADGSGQKRLTENPASDMIPTWSPDGKQIAFFCNRDGNLEIYIMNVDGSAQTNLTHHPAQDSDPVWSPDGQQIAFASDRDNPEVEYPENTGVYVMNVDGTGVKRLTRSSMPGFRPAWSPNSNCILYQSGVSFNDWIMLVEMNGSEPVKMVHAGSYPDWSPDGRWVVYAVIHGEWNLEIYTLDLNTLQTFRLTNNTAMDAYPVWKP